MYIKKKGDLNELKIIIIIIGTTVCLRTIFYTIARYKNIQVLPRDHLKDFYRIMYDVGIKKKKKKNSNCRLTFLLL